MLSEIGYRQVNLVTCLEDALDILSGATPDFAMLDINLNGRRSFPVAEVLKSRNVPFVFISGYGAGGLDGGFADSKVLQKPFRQRDLVTLIEGAVAAQDSYPEAH